MRRLALKTLLLLLPFALAAAVVAWVDPFRYFPWNAARDDADSADIAYRVDPPLWKLAAYRHHRAPNILLGDSRMALLDAALIGELAGGDFVNLGYGGGSLDEAIRTFWIADRSATLSSATFGINLDSYNQSNSKDRVTGTEQTLANPALYLCERLVLRTTYYQIVRRLTGRRVNVGVPPMDPDVFWRYQLDVTARIAYESYRYPDAYRRRLEEIAAHCRSRNIRLRFIIFPEHRDLADRAGRFGLGAAAGRMKADLQSLGETVDLSGVVDCSDRSLFTDPYHFNPVIGARIARYVWGRPAGADSTSSNNPATRSTIASGP